MRVKLTVFVMAVLVLVQFCIAGTILEADMIVTKDDRVFTGIFVTTGTESSHAPEEGSYKLEVKDAAGNVIWEREYGLKFIALTDPPVDRDYEIITEKIPYESRMYEIAFLKNGNVLMQRYLDFCDGNLICDNKENAVSCASDCTAADKDKVCISQADGICDPDCLEEKDSDCAVVKQKEKAGKVFIVLLIIALLALYIIVCVKIKKVHATCRKLINRIRGFWERKKKVLIEMSTPKARKHRR